MTTIMTHAQIMQKYLPR